MAKEKSSRHFLIDPEMLDKRAPVPTSIEVLEQGMPSEVREKLGFIGAMLAGDSWIHLFKKERKWLGVALMEIANGMDANKALRIKGRKNAAFKSLHEERSIIWQMQSMQEQGASKELAYRVIALARCHSRNNYPQEDEISAEAEKLKKRFARRKS